MLEHLCAIGSRVNGYWIGICTWCRCDCVLSRSQWSDTTSDLLKMCTSWKFPMLATNIPCRRATLPSQKRGNAHRPTSRLRLPRKEPRSVARIPRMDLVHFWVEPRFSALECAHWNLPPPMGCDHQGWSWAILSGLLWHLDGAQGWNPTWLSRRIWNSLCAGGCSGFLR